MALYGYHPPSITSSLRENSKVQEVKGYIEHQQQVLQLLKGNLNLAQNQMKQQADQHRNERSYDVGDWVLLWLQPYKKCPSRNLIRIINYRQSIWYIQGVAKDWYYGIQIRASYFFMSASSFPFFMLKQGYR